MDLKEEIRAGRDSVETGKVLPGWKFGARGPVVSYYDGECAEMRMGDRTVCVRAGGKGSLLDEWRVDNMYVSESVCVGVELERGEGFVRCGDYAGMFRRGSMNALVCNFLAGSGGRGPESERYFLLVFYTFENMRLLGEDTVRMLEEAAAGGDRFGLYGLGRYHYYVQPREDSGRVAEDCLSRAWESGVADAGAALAQVCRFGDVGLVDREKASRLAGEAADKGSMLAVMRRLIAMIYGTEGLQADIPAAMERIETLAAAQEWNPWWRYLRASAAEASGVRGDDVVADYLAAARGGLLKAWAEAAIAAAYDVDNDVIKDEGLYLRMLKEGEAAGDAVSCYLLADFKGRGLDKVPASLKRVTEADVVREIERAHLMGTKLATERLGDIYMDGLFGREADAQAAWDWYSQAAVWGSPTAWERMFDALRRGIVQGELRMRDHCALMGARLGSEWLLNETVIAYTQGRLSEFALEIEKYYVPVFDRECGDDVPDDDGRFDAYV